MKRSNIFLISGIISAVYFGFLGIENARANTVQIIGHVNIDQNKNNSNDFNSDPFVGSGGSNCERSKAVEGVKIRAIYESGSQTVEPDTCSSEIFAGYSANHANYVIDGVPRGEYATLKLVTPLGWQSAFDEVSGFKAGDTAGTSFMIVEQPEPLYSRVTVDGVTYPRHGQVVARGDVMYITWRSRGTKKIKLQYGSGSIVPSSDTVIAELDNDPGYYEWKVPADIAPGEFDYYIRISDPIQSGVERNSSKFTIVPGSDEDVIAVLAPNGGEQYHLGNIQDIRWSATGQSGLVRISAVSDNCGNSYGPSCSQGTEYLISTNAPNTGKFSWKVGEDYTRGNIPKGTYKIRIKHLSTISEDQSDNAFNIIEKEVIDYSRLSKPEFGYSINYPSSATHYDTNTSNEVDSIGRVQRTVVEFDDVIDDVVKHAATFQVSVYRLDKYDFQKQFIGNCSSYSSFDCNHGFVTIDGGVVEFREITQESKYSYQGIVKNDSYVYALFFGDEKNEQAKSIVHDMVQSFSIHQPAIDGFSASEIAVLIPNGGGIWYAGQKHNITWKADGLDGQKIDIQLVKKECSACAPSVELVIVENLSIDTGLYPWTIPDSIDPGLDYWIRIVASDPSLNNISDTSDRSFSIPTGIGYSSGVIEIKSPNGGEVLIPGEAHQIIWETERLTGERVDITLFEHVACDDCINYEPFERVVASGIDAESISHKWVVPNDLDNSKKYVVAVAVSYDLTRRGIIDISDSPFSVRSSTEIESKKDDDFNDTLQCLSNGTLIKSPNDPKIYIVENCKRRWIQTLVEFQREGHKFEDVQEVDPIVVQKLQDIKEAVAQIKEIVTELVRASNEEKVYRVIGERRLWIPTAEVFNKQGLDWGAIQDRSKTTVDQLPEAKLIRTSGDLKVYYLTDRGAKRHVPNPAVFESYGNRWEDVLDVDIKVVKAFPENILIRMQGDERVYKLENGKRSWVTSSQALSRLGYDQADVATVNRAEHDSYSEGADIN